jgi:DNA-binding LacI/PurR family transcriptional regulator
LAVRLQVDRAVVRRSLHQITEEGLVRRISPRIRVMAPPPPRNDWFTAHAVAIVSPAPEEPLSSHAHPGWAEFISQGAFVAARRLQWNVMAIHPEKLDAETIGNLVAAPPLGLLVPETFGSPQLVEQLIVAARAHNLPLVVYGQGGMLDTFDRVVSDHAHGCAALYRFLWQRGRRRILLVMPEASPNTDYWVERRIVGYGQGVAETGSAYHRVVRFSHTLGRSCSPETFAEHVCFHLGQLAEHLTGPEAADAILCASDGVLLPVASACRKLHRTPGEDVDVVGYDNFWEDLAERQCEPYRPPATVDKQNERMGAAMVDLLRERLAGALDPAPQLRVEEPKLIVTELQ